MIPDLALRALAAFISECRPDFDSPGVLAALRAEADSDPWQLGLRMIHRAADPKNLTPQLQPFDGEGFVSCRLHPGASVRTDGTCGVCLAERYAVPDDAPPAPKGDPGHPLRDAMQRVRESSVVGGEQREQEAVK